MVRQGTEEFVAAIKRARARCSRLHAFALSLGRRPASDAGVSAWGMLNVQGLVFRVWGLGFRA